MVIDTHCHLGYNDYEDREQVIKNMKSNIMIASGVSSETNKEVIKLVNMYHNIYGTIGIHPEYASNYNEEDISFIEKSLNNSKIVGIGEIGLDYHYSKENKEEQKKLFIRLIRLAKKYNKTVVVHSRDAIEETYDILKREYTSGMKIVMHCYSSSVEMAKKLIDLGVMLGIGGVVTFTNGRVLAEVVEKIDIKHLILETDSPYLAPTPYRGMVNEPRNVMLVAQKIAEIKGISIEEVIQATTSNAMHQFDLTQKM